MLLPPHQVLFGSFPIAHCRDPYSVVRYLAERIWPRLHTLLRLKPVAREDEAPARSGQVHGAAASRGWAVASYGGAAASRGGAAASGGGAPALRAGAVHAHTAGGVVEAGGQGKGGGGPPGIREGQLVKGDLHSQGAGGEAGRARGGGIGGGWGVAGELRGGDGGGGDGWSPLGLCEALAARHNWCSRRGGRPDVYRAANWLLRGALAGREGLVLAFLPPVGEG